MINHRLATASAFFGSPRPTAMLGTFLLAGTAAMMQARDAQAQAANTAVMGTTGDPASWHSDEFLRDWGLLAIGADHAYARGLFGQGMMLGQFDSGVFPGHPELAGADKVVSLHLGHSSCDTGLRLVADGCFHSRGDVPVFDITSVDYGPGYLPTLYGTYNNHGMHVAGTMVAYRDGAGMHGVAFGARLVTATYFRDTLTHYRYDAETDEYSVPTYFYPPYPAGPDIENYYAQLAEHGVRVTNNEIWNPVTHRTTIDDVRRTYENDRATYDAFADGSIKHDIVTVNALGNDHGAIANIFPGLPAFRPDAEPYWLSVANVYRKGDGSYAIDPSSSVCSYTQRWCISAPGTEIYSTIDLNTSVEGLSVLGGGTEADPYVYQLGPHRFEPGYDAKSGTSMAAPHAIGALGLLLERYPYLRPTQVRDVLLTTATPLGPTEIYGWGLINLRKAIDGPGQLLKDTLVHMNQRAGGAKVWTGQAWDDWRNDIGGPGKLVKAGIGWLRLSGSNRFGGLEVAQGVLELSGDNAYPATVTGGTLLLNGSLASTRLPVGPDGMLSGRGRVVGDVYLQGTLAAGQAGSGSLAIHGRYVQAAGSRYIAYITPAGASNHLNVTGRAVLEGGQVVVLHAPGTYGLGDAFAMLSATDGVQGKFAGVEHEPLLPFLKFGLSYAPTQVSVDVVRGATLASAAITPNQRAVARTADTLPIRQGLPRPLTQLTAAQAPAALNALTGETYASLRSVLVENSRFLRHAALARGNLDASDGDGARSAQGVWVDIQQGHGRLQDHARVAQTSYHGPQLILGYDHRFESGWRLGALGSASSLSTRTGLGDSGRIRQQSAGIHTGRQWARFGFSAGLAAARHRIGQDRNIRFPGFSDRTRAAFTARSTQAFMEGTYRLSQGVWALEPYLQWAQMRVRSPGFRETGGAAALAAKARSSTVNLATLGTRFQLAFGETRGWRLRAGLGRRLASGERHPRTTMALRGGDDFVVRGAPLALAVTLLEAGIVKALGTANRLALDYSGQFGSQTRDQAIHATWSMSL